MCRCSVTCVGDGTPVAVRFTCYLPRCNEENESDYVELSNFNIDLPDRKMSRLCGPKDDGNKRQTVSSDGSFFRVTFKSNHVFDATGFEAFYQFRKVEGHSRMHLNALRCSTNKRAA